MPPGGDGVYYLSTYLLVYNRESAIFDKTLNDDIICSTRPDHAELNDFAAGSCSAVVDVVAGDKL